MVVVEDSNSGSSIISCSNVFLLQSTKPVFAQTDRKYLLSKGLRTYLKEFATLAQCLFGEHLFSTDPKKHVAIVESEKTAIIAAGFIPDSLWLATAGKGNLKPEKLKVLHQRQVKLYPDLGACEKWQTIAAGLPNITVSTISTILEKRATPADRAQGLDLADYLLRENNLVF